MFRTHHTVKHLARAFAIVAVVTAFAVPSALAGTSSGDRTRCQTVPTDWVLVTDDLGIPSFQPVAQSACIPEASCVPSAHPGWIEVNDDLGVPDLVPAASFANTCAPVQPAPASKSTKSTKPKVKRSAYRGWVVVTDEVTGGSKLVAISNLRG